MPGDGFHPRPATARDVLAVATLTHGRYGGALDDWVVTVTEQLDRGERMLVAEVDGTVVAYAKTGHRAPHDPDDPAPVGMWLTGAVVAPDHRRSGIARRLVGLLVAERRPTDGPVWSMTDSANRASLALHAGLGFAEVLRAPRMLGQDFGSGTGVLLRLGTPRAQRGE